MPMRFTVLASGSGGNASLLETEGFGLLIDAGLGPRQLAARLAAVPATWQNISAVLLTHTHSDHWNENTLTYLGRYRIPLYCHPAHLAALRSYSSAFTRLVEQQLVHCYELSQPADLTARLRFRPFEVPHDGGPTFGFRLEGAPDLFGQCWALGYAADLGCWSAELADTLADVDLLALEFNHDIELERTSGRSARLIARVLGDHGHLSNCQAAAFLREVLRRSTPGRLRHVVQLHLSRDCNRPDLARLAAQQALADCPKCPRVHTASQYRPGPVIRLGQGLVVRRLGGRRRRVTAAPHAWLPGLEPSNGPAGDIGLE
jgi:phosphoribosyl 1,2-cyclic phosphodiesterase